MTVLSLYRIVILSAAKDLLSARSCYYLVRDLSS
jgi:hypothetical protein